MTDSPQHTPSRYYRQLSDALDKALILRERLDDTFTTYGPHSVGYAQDLIPADRAHGELMSAITAFLGHTTPVNTATSPQLPATELATTQWVQEYVAKHLPKQPTTGSWSAPTNLAIAVLSGVLGGLIAALLGAALLLILP